MGPMEQDIEKVKASLKPAPEPVARPVLVVVSGLPGTGKTHFCRKLAERRPLLIIESDDVRQKLFPNPVFSPEESARVFAVIHRLIADYLAGGISVILDATNLLERHREAVQLIALRHGAKHILVQAKAPRQIVKERLEARVRGLNAGTMSRADWTVYEKMRFIAQKIKGQHFTVDTSKDIDPVIEKVLREINRR